MSNVSAEKLRQYVRELEALDEKKIEINEEYKEILTHAKGDGFDVTVLKRLLKERRMDQNTLSEREALYDLYVQALEGASADRKDEERIYEGFKVA